MERRALMKNYNSKLNAGVIGLGNRGTGNLMMLCKMDDLNITALCDVYDDRIEKNAAYVKEKRGAAPFTSTDYTEIITRGDVDIVFVFSAWEPHIDMAVACMKAGKAVAVEVGGANSVNECWKLVNTYEETKTPCMLLENCCYDRNELMLMNMIKQDVFGEIVHCQGGYRHDIRDEIAFGKENRHYRLRNYLHRSADNYPTHDLGPIAQMLSINRGNRMVSLVSVASKARGLREYIKKVKGPDYYLSDVNFNQADIVSTIIKCANGETILLTLDTTLPRAYTRALQVQGTKGMYMEENQSIFLDDAHEKFHFDWRGHWNNIEEYRSEYEHPLWRGYTPDKDDGHGGMDYLVFRAFVDSVKNGEQTPIDVYDMAAWMSVTALSEESIVTGNAVPIPDFTNGKWMLR